MFEIRDQQFSVLRKQAIGDWLIKSFEGSRQVAARDPQTGDLLITDPRKNAIRISFDDHGFFGSIRSPSGRTWRFENDINGKLLGLQNPAGLRIETQYDTQGRIASISCDSRKLFDVTYDEVGRVTALVYPDASATRFAYTARNLVGSVTDRNGITEKYEYDFRGQLVSLTDGNRSRTSFQYAGWNRPVSAFYPDESAERYEYDPRGRLRHITAGSHTNAVLKYDERGNLIKISYADGEVIQFSYDDGGRLVEVRNEQLIVKYQYNTEGRLLQEDFGAEIIRYAYDDSGALVGMTYPSGDTVEFSYDKDLRLAFARDWNGGTYNFHYAGDDRTMTLSSPNGLKTVTQQSLFGKPEAIVVSKTAAADHSGFSLHYQYDAEGRVRVLKDSDFGTRTYHYDFESRILSVEADQPHARETFGYDNAGNRVTANGSSATFNSLNQLINQNGTYYDYDVRGNMMSYSSTEGSWKLTYNARDLLVRAEDRRGRVISFGYDAFGRRIWKRSGSKEVRYGWAGEQMISESTADGIRKDVRNYLYIPGTYTPLAMRVDSDIYCYHTDHLGTPRTLSDSRGNVVWSGDYSAFGRARIKVNAISNPLRYPGQYFDDETGLHYNRFRYYSPSLGRYITRDPVTYFAGLNFYTYVHNDPINATDPLGLWPSWKTVGAVAAGVAVGALVIATAGAATPLAIVAAGVLGGAVAGGLGEALSEKTFCLSCITKAALYGAFAGGVGAAAFLVAGPILAALGASATGAAAAAGAVAGMAGYTAGWGVTPGAKWDWESFACAGVLGGAMGFVGAKIGDAEPLSGGEEGKSALAEGSSPKETPPEPGQGIRIMGDDEFNAGARADLETIGATDTGKDLLARIENGFTNDNRNVVRILKQQDGVGPSSDPDNPMGASDGSGRTSTDIKYQPGNNDPLGKGWEGTPSDVQLLHELGHAANNSDGTNLSGTLLKNDPEGCPNAEEKQVLPIEQAYRKEKGYPPRPNYENLP
jgi:RHS repeat-associated protein